MSWWGKERNKQEMLEQQIAKELHDMWVYKMNEPLLAEDRGPERMVDESTNSDIAESEITALELLIFLYFVQLRMASKSQTLANFVSAATVQTLGLDHAFSNRFTQVEATYAPLLTMHLNLKDETDPFRVNREIFRHFCSRVSAPIGAEMNPHRILHFSLRLSSWIRVNAGVVDYFTERYGDLFDNA